MPTRIPSRSRLWLAATAIVLACSLVIAVLRVSQDRGRLATYPRVDDVIYMARGAHLARAVQEGLHSQGMRGAVSAGVADWKWDPPHSPWSSGCAGIGYLCFGYQDWAAYVFTVVPIGVFLLAAARLARRAGGRWQWRSSLLVVFAASSPFLAASAFNLKPDYCAGMLAAVGMSIALKLPLLAAPWARLVWIGAFFGLALLAKPAMMMPTSLLCVGMLAVCTLRDAALGRDDSGGGTGLIGLAVRAWGMVLGIAALMAFPHYAIAGGRAWTYSSNILAGDAANSWAMRGSWEQHAAYYLTGPGGHLMLDGIRSLVSVGCLIVLGSVLVFRRPWWRLRRRGAYWASWLAVLGMAYLGPTLVPVKIAQFASAFSALFWLLGIDVAASVLARRLPVGRTPAAMVRVAVAATVAVSLASYRLTVPLMSADRSAPARIQQAERDDLVRRVYEHVRAEATAIAARRRGFVRVAVAGSPNELDYSLLALWGVRDGVDIMAFEIRRVPLAVNAGDTVESLGRRRAGDTDLLIVCEPGTGLTRPKHETEGSDVFFLEIARHHPDLVLAAVESNSRTGKAVEVYRRRSTGTGD